MAVRPPDGLAVASPRLLVRQEARRGKGRDPDRTKASHQTRAVTASKIIDEIKSLTPEEQVGVARFVYQLDAERELSGSELCALAERFGKADDPIEASRVRETIVRGLYGAKPDA